MFHHTPTPKGDDLIPRLRRQILPRGRVPQRALRRQAVRRAGAAGVRLHCTTAHWEKTKAGTPRFFDVVSSLSFFLIYILEGTDGTIL